MEWWLALIVFFGSLMFLMALGIPIAFTFLVLNIVGVYFLWGGNVSQLVLSMKSSIAIFALLPLIFFVLMGSLLAQSGIAGNMIDTVNKCLGRLPGRLSLLAVVTGSIFAALSGSSGGSLALLGGVLLPQMEKYGYKKPMTLGPLMASGGLAIMIPPTNLGVFIAVLAEVSVGDMVVGIIPVGFMLAGIYAAYVIVRCLFQPSLAPVYEVGRFSLGEKIADVVKYVVPLGFIMFLVTGLIFLGIATPGEAACVGCAGSFVLSSCYGGLSRGLIKKTFVSTLRTVVMVLAIMVSAVAFSQLLTFTGASRGMIDFVVGLKLSPLSVVICMQLIVFILGCLMDVTGIIMITIPIFMPIVNAIGFSPLAFIVAYLLNIETAMITPPFGYSLFIMKGIAGAVSPKTTIQDVYKAATPFVIFNSLVIFLLSVFPIIALFLPRMVK